jgi:hypothetical protein
MSTILPFGSNTIPTFLYESFSYTISNPAPGTYTLTTSNTPGIPPGYVVNNGSNVVFSNATNGMNIGTEVFTITAKDASGITVATSSNNVTIGAGRFLDGSGSGYPAGSVYTFYKNEPITPLRLVAPFAIAAPTSVPTIPPGLTYSTVSSSTYDITGTPLTTVPQSNYLIIGKGTGANLGKIVTSQIGMVVSNERVLLNLSGTPIVSPMTVDTPITNRVLTARFPPYPSGGTLRYSWSGLPDGIVVKDLSGNTQVGPTFTPVDASSTLIITGTPTITAANSYRDANISSNVVTFTATRTNPLPSLSNSQAITFGFGETVLFDTPSIPTFYKDVALDPSATSFRAQTYFGSGSAIASMTAPSGLPAGLSLNFVAGTGRAYLTGTPTAVGSASYTIRAVNSNAILRDLSAPITVAADSVSFLSPPTPAVDICYNFILSRPIALELSGYYTSNIRFQAAAASRKPVTFSAPGLSGTGLSFSNVSNGIVQLVGVPDTVTPLTTIAVTASAVGTPATATRNFKLAVLNDVITISDISSSLLSFVQNRAITPIQLTATTLSERPVSSFTSANLPSGINLSTSGLLSGTPTDATFSPTTFTVTASTGYASQTKTYTYNTVQDNVLIVIPTTTVTVQPSFSGVEVDILAYSGSEGEFNPAFSSGMAPAQSTTATITTTAPNLISGNFSDVPVLAPEYRFRVLGTAGSFTAVTQINAVVTNPPTIQHSSIVADSIIYPFPLTFSAQIPKVSGRILVSTDSPTSFPIPFTTDVASTGPSTWSTRYTFTDVEGPGYDMARNSNVFVAVLGSNIIRSTDYGNTWSQVPSSNIQTVSNVFGIQYSGLADPLIPGPPRIRFANPTFGAVVSDGASTWWAMGAGTTDVSGYWAPLSFVRRSTDNGQTWVDISLALSGSVSPFILQSNKLSYNQGRLFYTGRQVAGSTSNAFYYADSSNITSWTKPLTTLGLNGSIIGIAFSNSTVFAAGDDSNGTATFVSTNNGTTWSAGTNPNPGPGSITDGYRYADIFQKYGYWFAGGISQGFGFLQSSSNLIDWDSRGGGLPGTYSATTENGITWISVGATAPFQPTRWNSNGTLGTDGIISNTFATAEIKRLYAETTVTPSNPTLTFSIPYDASGIGFTSPTQTQYTNWQFVPIPTIPVVATNPVPGSFLYYYAAGLPRGLTLNLDASGIESSITGTSTQFSDAFSRIVLYAALNPGGGGGGVAALSISMRTILPTVQKQQTSAGAWTSLVRQYTVVNAAQNSVNGRGLPATEPPLGEFTRPYPPDSVSAPGDPNCQKC